jgi:ABC-type transport system involved in multi-copper enzyme maturation permease subunit
MKKWFQQFFALARNSFVVLMSDPIMLIMHIFLICITLLIASLPGFTLGGQLKLVRDQAMALTFMSGSLVAAVGASKIISEDIRQGMLPTIMSRPVSYSALLAGKWFGLLASLLLIFLSATIACLWSSRIIYTEHMIETLGFVVYLSVVLGTLALVAARHYAKGGNYMWQANIALVIIFTLSFFILNFWGYNGEHQPYGAAVDWHSAFAYLYIFMALIIFSAIATLMAVMMDVSLLMACSVVIFFLGLFSAYFINLIIPDGFLNALFNTIIPNWQSYWISEIIYSPKISQLSFFLPRFFNTILQSIIFLVLATIIFERKEIAGSV